MNLPQRVVIGAIGLAAFLMLLYPPFYGRRADRVEVNLGYALLFDPPYLNRAGGFVHIPTLLVQLVGLVLVGGAAWLIVGSAQGRRESPPPKPSFRFDPVRAAAITELQQRPPSSNEPHKISEKAAPEVSQPTHTQRLLMVAKRVRERRGSRQAPSLAKAPLSPALTPVTAMAERAAKNAGEQS